MVSGLQNRNDKRRIGIWQALTCFRNETCPYVLRRLAVAASDALSALLSQIE
jgi:hypothetical protein